MRIDDKTLINAKQRERHKHGKFKDSLFTHICFIDEGIVGDLR